MYKSQLIKFLPAILALAASLFGLVTIIAGARVLAGADPGYVVFRPLVIFNTAMGIAYVAAGIVAWRSPGKGKHAAAAIWFLNLIALAAIVRLHNTGGAVAGESLRAMSFRTLVWLLLYLGLSWSSGRARRPAYWRKAGDIE